MKTPLRGMIAPAILAAFVVTAPAGAQPKLSIEKNEIDLGIVYSGSIAKTSIALKNIGKDPLKIFSIRTSCGCTKVKDPKPTLAPGESDALVVEFNSSGFRGRLDKFIDIETNDPVNQYASITVVADVREELQPTNNFSLLWFGDVPLGKKVEQTIAFRNVTNRPITIKNHALSTPEMSINYARKTVSPADSLVVTVSVVPYRNGFHTESFVLETDSKNQSHVSMRVRFVGVQAQ